MHQNQRIADNQQLEFDDRCRVGPDEWASREPQHEHEVQP